VARNIPHLPFRFVGHLLRLRGRLSRDQGLIAQALQRYQDLLPAADKWAAQTFDYQERQLDPNRLSLPDPWQFLLEAPGVSPRDKTLFRAAQSQLPALRHLIHILAGIATLNTDWYQLSIEARTKGDKRKYFHAIGKVADVHVLNQRIQEDVRMQNNPSLLKEMERLLKKRRTRLIHQKGGRAKMERLKKWPSWEEFEQSNRLPVVLVEWWVRCGTHGAPGLMFWRNEALTKFLQVHLDQSNLSPLAVKKIRQQLGLIPDGDKEHFVWDVSITGNSDGNYKMEGFFRSGKQSFGGVVSPQKRISEAVLLALGKH